MMVFALQVVTFLGQLVCCSKLMHLKDDSCSPDAQHEGIIIKTC